MKAIRMHALGGPDVLQLDDVETPTAGTGQVLVRVEAAGVAFGDIMKRQGGFGRDLPLPCGIGLQVAGTVAAVGPGATAPAPGTAVMAWVDGGYAEYALAADAAVVPLPDGIDMRAAAVLPVQGVTAYQTLQDAGRLRSGESVLVHAAAGGVGSIAVQLARLLGAGTVLGTASRPDKRERIASLGATAIDYTRDDWPQRVRAATGGRGVDLVLDSVSGAVAARSLECLAPFGRVVTFGAAGGSAAEVSAMPLMHHNASMIGYSLQGWLERPGRVAAAVGDLVEHLGAGRLDVVAGQVLPLAKADEAHRCIGARETIGVTILLP